MLILLFFCITIFSMDPCLYPHKGLNLRMVPGTDYRPNIVQEYSHIAYKKQRTQEIYEKNEYVENYPLDKIDLLLHKYPIARSTFNYIMRNSEHIFPAIETKPIKFENVPYYFKTGLNRLDGLDAIRVAIGSIEQKQKSACTLGVPKKEAMLFLDSDRIFTPCIVSHEVDGSEVQMLSAKEVMDLYSLCKKANHPQMNMRNFYDAKPENIIKGNDGKLYIIDTGKEGFYEIKKENFKFFIADHIRYGFHSMLTNEADQFLLHKIQKHKDKS